MRYSENQSHALKLKYDLNNKTNGEKQMVGLAASLPAKWEQFLKHLADDHEVDLNTVVGELCEWAFSDPESKEQFINWLDETYPLKGDAEEEARDVGEEASEEEEEREEESEEESHEHRD